LWSEKLSEDEDEDRPRLGFDFAVAKMGGNQRCAYSVVYSYIRLRSSVMFSHYLQIRGDKYVPPGRSMNRKTWS